MGCPQYPTNIPNLRGSEKRLSNRGERFKFVMGPIKVAGDNKGIGGLQLSVNNFVKFSPRFGLMS